MPKSSVAQQGPCIGCKRYFGSIRHCCGSYPSGRPQWAGWSRRGKSYGCEAYDGSQPSWGTVKKPTSPPLQLSRKQTSTWRVAACCGQGQFLSRGSEAIVTHTISGWTLKVPMNRQIELRRKPVVMQKRMICVLSFFVFWRLRVRPTDSPTQSRGPSRGKSFPAWQPSD